MSDETLWQRFLAWRWERLTRAAFKSGYSPYRMRNFIVNLPE